MTENQPTSVLPASVAILPRPLGDFDLRFAVAMARLADIAYSPFELDGGGELRARLAPGALTVQATFAWLPADKNSRPRSWRDRGVQGYLAAGEDYAVLAFRGTSDPKDWLTDVRARKQVVRVDGHVARVHSGFAKAYSQVASRVDSAITDLMASRPLPLFIVGHSLGGAMAQIAEASLHYSGIAATYTFGCPKVASIWYRRDARAPHHRIVNGWDVVPEVPSLLRGYAHKEACWHLKHDRSGTTLSRNRSLQCSTWIGLRDSVGLAFDTNWAGVHDHRLANYITRLEAAEVRI